MRPRKQKEKKQEPCRISIRYTPHSVAPEQTPWAYAHLDVIEQNTEKTVAQFRENLRNRVMATRLCGLCDKIYVINEFGLENGLQILLLRHIARVRLQVPEHLSQPPWFTGFCSWFLAPAANAMRNPTMLDPALPQTLGPLSVKLVAANYRPSSFRGLTSPDFRSLAHN